MTKYSTRLNVECAIFKMIYRPLLRRSARQILQGRLLDPDQPEKGRWLKGDVKGMLEQTWARLDKLLPQAELDVIPTLGNRHNLYLAVITTAAYQVLLENGHTKERASVLVADVGWKLYELGIKAMSLPFRLTSKDPKKRIEKTIDALMIFPFNAPGRPGYEAKVVKQDDKMLTHWTWCPPQAYVRNLVEREGDKGELDAFYNSWCLYDWPGADLMADDGVRSHYQRKKTLSKGDAVCDMCWRHKGENIAKVV